MAHLEVCTGSYQSVLAAREGGAHRIELCSGLDEGGLTPSIGLIRAALQVQGIRKHVLIRPRGGDFLYTSAERSIITADIVAAREAGVDGVVIGALTADGDIDVAACREWMDAAEGIDVTFHRAFDMCRDSHQALEQIVELGCSRILTSGTAATAEAGIPMLRQLIKQAAGRITIMPGCGVSPDNAARIIAESGAVEIHASARASYPSQMQFRHQGVSMGKAGADEYATMETSVEKVRTIVERIG